MSEQQPPAPRRPTTVRGWLQAEVPAFIPCYNNPTYARGMVRQLRTLGFRRIVLVDNASTSPDMRAWLDGIAPEEAEVIALAENRGPRDIFMDLRNLVLLPRHFVVTDPDLVLNPALPDGFLGDLALLVAQHKVGKAGCALDISEPEAMREETFRLQNRDWKIWEWEAQWWRKQVATHDGQDPVYEAPVDTTFALYDRTFFRPAEHLKAVRVAGRFTAKHLPWYRDIGVPGDEAELYRRTEKFSWYLKAPGNPAPPP